MKDARSPASSYLPWYVLNSTSQRNMISLQTVMVNDDHHHELQHCLLKETSSKRVGGWCFFLRYLFTSSPRQSYRQWHLTLSTFSRQWCWLTKVVLPRSNQHHHYYKQWYNGQRPRFPAGSYSFLRTVCSVPVKLFLMVRSYFISVEIYDWTKYFNLDS